MKTLYCFDFDGTITKQDSMFLFLRFCNPQKYNARFFRFVPLFFLMKTRLISAETVKRMFISSFLKGKTTAQLQELSLLFFLKYKDSLLREKAVSYIRDLDKNNSKAYLVSASLDIWLEPFAEYLSMDCISTKAEYKKGVFTGKFATPNCNKEEKVMRIKNEITTQEFDKTIAFGDTNGDEQMLAWANEGHFRYFE